MTNGKAPDCKVFLFFFEIRAGCGFAACGQFFRIAAAGSRTVTFR
jgi:hypothetical protein